MGARPHINELFDLSGKVAMVTGGAGWLGSAMSEALAEAGAKVAIIGRNAERLEKATSMFNSRGLDTIGIAADVMEEKSVRECIDKVAADCGRLDILVNCASALEAGGLIDSVTMDELDEAFHETSSYILAAQQAVVHMRKTGGGMIINLGSKAGMTVSPPDLYENLMEPMPVGYEGAKAAVVHVTKYMAVYWAGDNIRANCITPGAFPGKKAQEKFPEIVTRQSAKTPLGRIGEPRELKGAVVFLASEASSYVTGHNLVVDGGWTAW